MSQSYASFRLVRTQNTHVPVSHRLCTSSSPLAQHIYMFTGMFCSAPARGKPVPNLDLELRIILTKHALGLTCRKTSFSGCDSDLSLQAGLSQVHRLPGIWRKPLLLTQNIPKQPGRREERQVDLWTCILDSDSF